MAPRRPNYETDTATWPEDACYTVRQYPGIAIDVYGWETEPDEDTEWSGCEVRTGRVLVRMVGDDRRFSVDPEDLTMIGDMDYCAGCGQIGCVHDGRDRDEQEGNPRPDRKDGK